MKQLFILAVFVFTASTGLFAQQFEGRVVYNNVYQSKKAQIPSARLNAQMGDRQVYLIRQGAYKSEMNGVMQWQLYTPATNMLYTKMSTSETIFGSPAERSTDRIIKSTVNRKALTVLGVVCDELILTCASGVQKYYYSSKYSIDPSLFKKHLFGNWYDYVKIAKAVPLKMIIETPQYTVTSTATEITAQPLSDATFSLPPSAQVQEMAL